MSTSGVQGNADSSFPAISADGRFVAFTSGASNLVPGDSNGVQDVFVRDLVAGTTVRVSEHPSGSGGDGTSWFPSISSGGGLITFSSLAANLVSSPPDLNGSMDVFVYKRFTGEVLMASLTAGSGLADGDSAWSQVSAGGRFVLFESMAANLAPADTNGVFDVFIKDIVLGTVKRVSRNSSGVEGNLQSQNSSMSSSATVIAFQSDASNLVVPDGNGVADVFLTYCGPAPPGHSFDVAGTITPRVR